eukprot:jgi/Botrbrau1/16232/Bobra.0066s0018.1
MGRLWKGIGVMGFLCKGVGAWGIHGSSAAAEVLQETGAETGLSSKECLNLDCQEVIAARLPTIDLARKARLSKHWREFLAKRMEAEKRRLKDLVLQGTSAISPAQISAIVRAAKRFCAGSNVLWGNLTPPGAAALWKHMEDHIWQLYAVANDGSMTAREFSEYESGDGSLIRDGSLILLCEYVLGSPTCFIVEDGVVVEDGVGPRIRLFAIDIYDSEVKGWPRMLSFCANRVHADPGMADEFVQGLYLLLMAEEEGAPPHAQEAPAHPVPSDAFFLSFFPRDRDTIPDAWSIALAAGARVVVSGFVNRRMFPKSFNAFPWKPLWFKRKPTWHYRLASLESKICKQIYRFL